MTLAEAAEYFERAAQCYEKAAQSWQQSTYREAEQVTWGWITG